MSFLKWILSHRHRHGVWRHRRPTADGGANNTVEAGMVIWRVKVTAAGTASDDPKEGDDHQGNNRRLSLQYPGCQAGIREAKRDQTEFTDFVTGQLGYVQLTNGCSGWWLVALWPLQPPILHT
jgi:hypothetical protein